MGKSISMEISTLRRVSLIVTHLYKTFILEQIIHPATTARPIIVLQLLISERWGGFSKQIIYNIPWKTRLEREDSRMFSDQNADFFKNLQDSSEFYSRRNLAEAHRARKSFGDWFPCWQAASCRPHSAPEELLRPWVHTPEAALQNQRYEPRSGFPHREMNVGSSGWASCSRWYWENIRFFSASRRWQKIHYLEARETSD